MGFEPTTYALRVRCSTPELKWQGDSLFPISLEMSRGLKIEYSGRLWYNFLLWEWKIRHFKNKKKIF